ERLHWHRRRAWWPEAELLLEFVGSPARLVMARHADVREHGAKAHALVRIGRFNWTAILIDRNKLAFGEDDRIGSALRQKATMRPCFAAGAQGTALAAFDQS